MAVRKVMHMRRGARNMTTRGVAGAEPGVDPRRASADLQYGGIRQNCVIEMFDYSVSGTLFLKILLTNASHPIGYPQQFWPHDEQGIRQPHV